MSTASTWHVCISCTNACLILPMQPMLLFIFIMFQRRIDQKQKPLMMYWKLNPLGSFKDCQVSISTADLQERLPEPMSLFREVMTLMGCQPQSQILHRSCYSEICLLKHPPHFGCAQVIGVIYEFSFPLQSLKLSGCYIVLQFHCKC